ncbi:MAG: CHASE2 domain-containing protein [bacterium]|nr:CHASE2 domain-containing protein [bacterium]
MNTAAEIPLVLVHRHFLATSTAIAVALLAACAIWSEDGKSLTQAFADAALHLASLIPPEPVSDLPDVMIVALDPASLRAVPDSWPWPRSHFVSALERLSGAGAVSVSLHLPLREANSIQSEPAFPDEMKAYGPIVQRGPAPGFSEQVRANGNVRSLRGVPIDYRRAHPEIPVIPIVRVLSGSFDASEIAGRHVLIGPTSAELGDLWPTPIGPSRPGVWIEALALRGESARELGLSTLKPVGKAGSFAFVLLVSGIAAIIGTSASPRRFLALAGLAIGSGMTSLAALVLHGLQLDPVLPASAIAIHGILALDQVRRRATRLERGPEGQVSYVPSGSHSEQTGSEPGLDLALRLLGEAISANSVALFRARADGTLSDSRAGWNARGFHQAGDFGTACEALSSERMRVFEGSIPGTDCSGLAVYAPLFAERSAVGVLVLERGDPSRLDEHQIRTIKSVGTQLALALDSARRLEDVTQKFTASITAIASAVEARDGYTHDHCPRLAALSLLVGQRLGLSEGELEGLGIGALLHDLGKVGVREEILMCQGKLTPDDRFEIEKHPVIGHRIVSGIPGLSPTTLSCVRHHHERWDGTGYPDGLAGDEIPISARIVSVVDVWEALSSARPHKPEFDALRIREIMRKDSGIRFDPVIVDLFFSVLDTEGEEVLALIDSSAREKT